MTRYADPTRCPDCRCALPPSPDECPGCELPLSGPLGRELLRTLQYADTLLVRLRTAPQPLPVCPRPADPVQVPHRRTGLHTASVPTILLGLGALCLLVAAVTFLAFAWSWMGVGGRTAVLLGLTGAAGGLGVWLGGRGLRVAAESLSAVALGLVAMDVAGAVTAGWLGARSDESLVLLAGAGVAVAGAAMVIAPARLVVPQIGTVLGLVVAFLAALGITEHDLALATGAVLALAGAAWLGRVVAAPVLAWVAAAGTACWWCWIATTGLEDAAAHPTLQALWAEGHAHGLAVATLLLIVPAVLAAGRSGVVSASLAAATTLLTVTLTLPVADNGATGVGLVALAALLVWTAAAAVTPARWRTVPTAPLALSALAALGVLGLLVTSAAERLTDVGAPFTRELGVRLSDVAAPASPLLALPLAAGLLLALRVVGRGRGASLPLTVAGLAVAGATTVASYPVSLGLFTGLLAVVAVSLAVVVARVGVGAAPAAVAAAALAVVGAALALPSAGLTSVSTAAAVAVGAVLCAARSEQSRVVGRALLPGALGAFVWCLGELGDVDLAWRALPVLAAVGLLAIAVPRFPVEAVAGVTGLVVATASVWHASDTVTSLAVHLTLAGALVTTSSLVHSSRRRLAWVGGFLLAAATWVRLFDLGVDEPEAYTLPTAVALLLVGLHRLWREPDSSTDVLLPGLALATVPSLLWVMAVDPVSPRAVLLGSACLGLVLVGSRLDWSVPLVLGAAVGALLVLREVAPYAAAQPRWILIGLAGTLLTVVGVTWERRVVELRQAAAYLERLR